MTILKIVFNFSSSLKLLKVLCSVLLLNLFACTKDPESNQSTVSPTPNSTPTRPSNIIDKSPKYSNINTTTSSGFANKIFPGIYITAERASQYKLHINQRSLFDADYRFWDPSKCYLDYNGDGYLDMFAFLTNFKDATYASSFGKILLVNDILGSSPKLTVLDANRRFMPRLKVLDLNKDGINEVLFSAEDDHILINGTHGPAAPIQLAIISKNGDVTYKEIGESVSIHGQGFGDVDNDGDIDILVWRNAYTNPSNADLGSLPILYLNDGSNNFIKSNSFTQFIGLNTLLPIQSNGKRKNYAATTVDLFDIDGDGNLDMLTSYTHNQTTFPSWEFNHMSTRVYWGNGSGTFDMLNRFIDLPVEYLQGLGISNSINVSPLGFSYIDFDKDGDMDLLSTATPNYGGFIIQLCENLGNRQFRDITKQKIDTYSSIYPRNSQVTGTFPNFYELRIFDKDNDGDFDLIPDHVATWGIWQFPISQDLFWENTGGQFKLRK